MKKKIIVFMCLLFAFSFYFVDAAEGTGKAYTYNHKNQAASIPDPYTVSTVIYGGKLGFEQPVDMTWRGGEYYLLCADGSVVVLDETYEFVRVINLMRDGSAFETLSPKSIWSDFDGTFLISDHDKKEVIRINESGEVLAEYKRPQKGIAEDSEFMPYKAITDYLGRIYVLSDGEYRGMIQLDRDGTFMSYYGSKSVEVTAKLLLDMAWRKFMSREQISNTARYLPTEYSNMTIDPSGFLYAVSGSASSVAKSIVKLNSNGTNVLKSTQYGDFNLGHYNGTWYKTSFNAVVVDQDGFITVADKTWNRLMQYSSEGQLLYIFGGTGEQVGTFQSISQLLTVEDNLLVLDTQANSITVFSPTVFGNNVRNGYTLYEKGLFAESIEPWENVLAEAGNYEAAYSGIGKAYQLQKNYEEAMHYFKLGYAKSDYSKAYQRYRSYKMRSSFPYYMAGLFLIVLVSLIVVRRRKRKYALTPRVPLDKRGKGAYIIYSVIHPFDGFSEMRHNKKGSVLAASVLAVIWFVAESLEFRYRGFLFNDHEPEDFSVLVILLTSVGLLLVFSLSNWLLATFFDGKGKLKDVWIVLGYSLIPKLITMFADLLLSHFFSLEESFFLYYLNLLGTVLTVIIALIGLGEVHQYSFKKNILSSLTSLAGVLIILFIVFLMINLTVQVKDFADSIAEEISYRISAGF